MNDSWKLKKIGEFLKHREGTPDESKFSSGEIPIISKISFNDGKVELRNDGKSNTKLIRILPNDLIISGINAEKGAIAINDFNQEITATIHYSAYYPAQENINLKFLLYYLKSSVFQKNLKFTLANGIKTELKPKKFLSIEIPFTSFKEQNLIVEKIESIKNRIDQIKKIRDLQNKEIENLLFSKYHESIEKAKLIPMSVVAPIHRRKVELQEEEIYYELGVRSFGRGLFEKPSFRGKDLTWQKPYWLKEGDLLLSNIKAWEGAVALIPEKYNNWVGSHRYITCFPNSEMILGEFLFYYFTTSEGVEKLNSASPGSADRNRTLNTKKLQNILVPVPDLAVQKVFIEFKNKIKEVLEGYIQTQKELDDLLPSLLDKAFKGEL